MGDMYFISVVGFESKTIIDDEMRFVISIQSDNKSKMIMGPL